MKKTAVIILLVLIGTSTLSAEGPLDVFKNKKLEVSIVTKILEENSEVIWNVESSEVTVSGRTVTVKLKGESIRILAEITPYILDDGSILLVAKGDVLMSSADEGLQYKTTLKSLPVNLGEKAFFFPLGVAFDSDKNIYTIQLEIQVDEASGSEEEQPPQS